MLKRRAEDLLSDIEELKKSKRDVLNESEDLNTQIKQLHEVVKGLKKREERQEENIIQLLDKKLHVARDAISSELECVICKGPFIEPATTNCQHTFCAWCILQSIKTDCSCPTCNQRVTHVYRSLVYENVVNLYLRHISPGDIKQREAQRRSRDINRNIMDWKTLLKRKKKKMPVIFN